MTNRFFEPASMAVLAAAIGMVLLAPAPAAAQTQATAKLAKDVAANKKWIPPRTADGQPELQGVYTNASAIPMERPKDLGAKEFFTKEEAEAYAAKAKVRQEVVAPGTYGDLHYNMAQFGLDRGQGEFAATLRTSLIVGPDGQVPPLLPAAKVRMAARAAANKGT